MPYVHKVFAPSLVLAMTVAAYAQEPVRLDFQLVPQTGFPGNAGGVVDQPLSTPATPVPVSNNVQRFELQYRVLDLDANDNMVPAGVKSALINIRLSNPAAGTLAAVQLSRWEAVLASGQTVAPPSPDLSGLPLGLPRDRQGMHTPFRWGFADQNSNDSPANGTVTSEGIIGISPFSISQNNQGNVNVGASNEWFYGLYSFTFTPSPGFSGDFSIVAEASLTPGAGHLFDWWDDVLEGGSRSSNNAAPASAYLRAVPAPGGAMGVLVSGGLLLGRRRRR